MAYRQTISKPSMLNEEIHRSNNDDDTTTTTAAVAPPSPVVAEAIGASVAHRDSSGDRSKGSATHDYTSTGSTNEPRGFWGVIARKAKSIIDDDNAPPRSFDTPSTIKTETVSTSNQVEHRYESFEHSRNMDGPKLRKGLDKLTSSLNQIGGTIGNAFEMAYRRSQTISKASMLNEDIHRSNSVDDTTTTTTTTSAVAPPSPVAAEAIGASVTHRDSSDDRSKGSATYDYTSTGSTNEPRGFWGVIARKAKSIIDDDNAPPPSFDTPSTIKTETVSTSNRVEHRYESFEHSRNMDGPKLRKGLDKLTSSLNQIGGTIGNAFEEGRTIVDKKTQDIIQETRKLQNRRKGMNDEQDQLQEPKMQSTQQQTNLTNQLKASRDVANATAAKAKLLLRELKTVKADLAFAKERSSQLEEENKMLREALEKGDRPTDDDMIRLQLELLLAEKARLANENSVYARENRFLREIVEYHQLSIQDVVYLDEGIEEVTEVNPELSRTLSTASSSPPSLHSSPHEPLERTTS